MHNNPIREPFVVVQLLCDSVARPFGEAESATA